MSGNPVGMAAGGIGLVGLLGSLFGDDGYTKQQKRQMNQQSDYADINNEEAKRRQQVMQQYMPMLLPMLMQYMQQGMNAPSQQINVPGVFQGNTPQRGGFDMMGMMGGGAPQSPQGPVSLNTRRRG